MALSVYTPCPVPSHSAQPCLAWSSLCILPTIPGTWASPPHLSALHIPPVLLDPAPVSPPPETLRLQPHCESYFPMPQAPSAPSMVCSLLVFVWGMCFLLNALACHVSPACLPSQGCELLESRTVSCSSQLPRLHARHKVGTFVNLTQIPASTMRSAAVGKAEDVPPHPAWGRARAPLCSPWAGPHIPAVGILPLH